MSDTHLTSTEELKQSYSLLFTKLYTLIDITKYDEILNLLKKTAYPRMTQLFWDAVFERANEFDFPKLCVEHIAAAKMGNVFDFDAYQASVTTEHQQNLGKVMRDWQEAERKFGGLYNTWGMFSSMGEDECTRLVSEIHWANGTT